MAAKRPTGELPKRNSNLAKFIAGNAKTNKLNPAQSRVAAGKYRDEVKKTGAKTMDQTGVALRKAIQQTQKSSAKPSTVQQVAKRFNVTAREARDIATAIGSIAASSNTGRLKKTSANLVKQVKEVGTAATTGKKGTSSDLTQKNMSASKPYTYRKGTKRK
jgi:phage terminase Nu1 subunit (DNA packaging protein)